jgi:Flp pilus assembly protein TadG
MPARLLEFPRRRLAPPRAGLVARWAGATDGLAIIEFALVVPVMLVLLLGMTELTLAVSTDRKLTLLSRSLADLTSRAVTTDGSGTTTQSTVNGTEMTNIFAASGAILQPSPGASPRMVVSSMKASLLPDGVTYAASVAWSCASGAGAAPKATNTTYPVPAGFQAADKSDVYYVLAETTLPYRPTFGVAITGTLNLNESTPWPVRNGTKVKFVGTCPPGCTCPENAS